MNLSLQSVGRRSVQMLCPIACFQPRNKVGMLVEKMIFVSLFVLFFNRPCMKKNVSLQRRELSVFVLHHQHGRRDVSWKPATTPSLESFRFEDENDHEEDI